MDVSPGTYMARHRLCADRVVSDFSDGNVTWHWADRPAEPRRSTAYDFETWCIIADPVFAP